ncbi:hypothetical protein PMIN06_002584 [Paraphaeosphaeria minitans]
MVTIPNNPWVDYLPRYLATTPAMHSAHAATVTSPALPCPSGQSPADRSTAQRCHWWKETNTLTDPATIAQLPQPLDYLPTVLGRLDSTGQTADQVFGNSQSHLVKRTHQANEGINCPNGLTGSSLVGTGRLHGWASVESTQPSQPASQPTASLPARVH